MRIATSVGIVFLIVTICFAVVYFLVPPWAQLTVLILIVLPVVFAIFLGNNIIANYMNGSKRDISSVMQQMVNNVGYKYNMPEVDFYLSTKFNKNIYIIYIGIGIGRPIIVIGDEVFKILSNSELETVIYLVFNLLRQGGVKYRCWINYLLLFFEWPKMILPKINFESNQLLVRLVNYYLFPIKYLRYLIVDKNFEKLVTMIDSNIVGEQASIIFKIKNISRTDKEKEFDFIENFSLVSRVRKNFLSELIYKDTVV